MLKETILMEHERLMEEERKKDDVRMKEQQRIIKKVYTVDSDGLFSFYIPNPNLLLDRYSGLERLRRYRIFSNLDLTLYLTNCFVYALKQYGVPSDKLNVIKSFLTGIHFKIKDIGYLGKLLKLGFIIYLAKDHIKEEYRLIKLGKPENNYIIGYKSCEDPIPLLIYMKIM